MGIVFAGYGTYVSTLWFMLGRLNAHALSPRFLLNSTLKAAIGILIGFIAAMSVGFFGKPESAMSAQMLLFMVGFFHDWALGYIRKKAVELFHRKLARRGYLLLGHSESLINLSTAFELVHLDRDMVYRKP